jgi:hypothetical protein
MKWAILIAVGSVLAVTVATDLISIRHLFGLPALQPIHYLGRDAYDLSAVRRQPSERHRALPQLRRD